MQTMSEQDNIPLDALISRHETQSGVSRDDEMAVAQLFKTVGDELYTVDHANVGGQSNRALQLDKNKVFSSIPKTNTPVQQAPVQQAPVQQAPVQQVVTAPPTVNNTSIDDNIIERLSVIEDKVNKLVKTVPKSKCNVKFKSDNISGTFDNFDDIVDVLRKSLNKSSKRITITRVT
jgi:hypothetical protein